MLIRECLGSDTLQCKKLWLECFPKDTDFCGYYFDNIHCFGKSLVCEADGCVASYLNIIPFTADYFGTNLKCSYIYGVATDPKYRKKGYMRALMNRAHKICSNDSFTFLVPSVSGIYEKFGYKTISKRRSIDIVYGGSDCKSCNDLQHLNMIYDEFRKKFDLSLKRSDKWWEFIYHTAIAEGFRFIANDGAYAVVCGNEVSEIAYVSEKYRDKLNIGETVLTLPEVMAHGNIDFNNNYIAMMLD
ncbi:MAG: GNAT family N-acetyltransferase [Clostridia bacterium]|nr:GNAT family N-acetyltransferase [Clostridia bacterium]